MPKKNRPHTYVPVEVFRLINLELETASFLLQLPSKYNLVIARCRQNQIYTKKNNAQLKHEAICPPHLPNKQIIPISQKIIYIYLFYFIYDTIGIVFVVPACNLRAA